jgi:peroxiredoxin
MRIQTAARACALLTAAAFVAFASFGVRRARGEDPLPTTRSDSVREFALEDLDGKKVALSGLREAKVVVLAWTAPGCPIAKVYGPRQASLAGAYRPKGVRFLGVDSNASEDVAALRAQVAASGIGYPVLLDRDGALAQRVGVTSTTAVVVLDANRRVRYRGAVDDQYGIGGRKTEPTASWLRDAIDAVLENRAVAVSKTDAPGCAITFAAKVPAPADAAPDRTWSGGVGALVEARCAKCHRPAGGAPFSLRSYDDVKSRTAVIRDVVSTGRMPPFHADVPRGVVVDDPRLSDVEKARLLAWVDAGAPVGDATKVAAPADSAAEASADAWELGKPDAVYAFPTAQPIPADGVVPYRFVTIPTDQSEDKWVTSVEVQPGDPAVVHHVLVALQLPGQNRKKSALFDPTAGFFAAMVPGGRSLTFPEGMAKRLPKGASLVFQMHYTPYGVATEDRTRIGMRFAPAGWTPTREVFTAGVFNPRLKLPPGAKDVEVVAQLPVLFDGRILAYMPHMHLRGTSFRYEIVRPGKPPEPIFSVPRYDFNWQRPYRLVTPQVVPKGTFLRGVATYDNSADNPYNPDPAAEVTWGDQTWDEMMIGYVDYVRDP